MQKAFLILTLILSLNSWALGGYSTLSGDAKTIADAVKEKLVLNDEDTYQIYEQYLKGYINTKNWSFNGYSNSTLSSNKIDKSENKIYFLNFVTDNRFTNITLIKYAKEKQVYIHALETLSRSSQTVIDKYNTLKNDKTYTLDTDTEEFSIFSKKDYTARIKTLVYSGNGGIQYIDFFVYDLKK
jgi:hypothetical protein